MAKNWQHYWKAILAFLVPGAVIIGASVIEGTDGDSTITAAEWVTAVVAMVVTGGAVLAKENADPVLPSTSPSEKVITPPPPTET